MRLTLRLETRPPPANDVGGKQPHHGRHDRPCDRPLNRGDDCRAGHASLVAPSAAFRDRLRSSSRSRALRVSDAAWSNSCFA